MLRALPSLLALLLLLPAGVRAQLQREQSDHTKPSIGPNWIFYTPSDADHGAWGTGVQGKLPAGPEYALQASLDRTHHSAAGANYKDTPLQFSLLGYFTPESPGSFYVMIGYGWYWVAVDGPGAHTETGTRPHVGAGLELLSAGRFSFDASYRFIWSAVYRPSDYGHPFGSGFQERGHMWTLSVAYRL